MTRRLGERVVVQRTYQLEAKLVKQLDEYCKQTGIARGFVVEKALQAYLEEHGGDVD